MKFEYLEARSIDEAVSLLGKYDGRAKLIAGGTDLVVQMRRRMKKPEYVINIANIKELNHIHFNEKDGLKIGALTPIRSLEKSAELRQRYPVIGQAASVLASVGIRTIATLGGNLCNASPSADTAPSLIALGAQVKIIGPGGERKVSLEDFFTGPGTTALGRGELLAEVTVPLMPARTGAVYLKHGIRGSIDLAIVGVAAVITLEGNGEAVQEAKIVLGAVAPTPMRARKAEAVLKGKKVTEADIEEAARLASNECQPISDVRSTKEYRREMVNVFMKYAIREALSSAKAA